MLHQVGWILQLEEVFRVVFIPGNFPDSAVLLAYLLGQEIHMSLNSTW